MKNDAKKEMITRALEIFLLLFGMHWTFYFIRKFTYLTLIASLADSAPALYSILRYFGHLVFLAGFFVIAYFFKEYRPKLIGAITKLKPSKAVLTFIIGLAAGCLLNSICVLAAKLNGNITIETNADVNIGLLIFAFLAVFIQSTTEELESRGMVFGMLADVVPTWAAAVISAIFFAALHLLNNGITWISFISIIVIGIAYAFAYYYTGSIYLPAGMHTAWNFTQDFIFGLPNSGNPSAMSILKSTALSDSWAYSTEFGVEGSYTAIAVNVILILVIVLANSRHRATD